LTVCLRIALLLQCIAARDDEATASLLQHTTMAVLSSDGHSVIELHEGGSEARVTASVGQQYLSLALAARLCEFSAQVHAMRIGFASVVPVGIARLFTWYVCGRGGAVVRAPERVWL
jgi:hypothetical protein